MKKNQQSQKSMYLNSKNDDYRKFINNDLEDEKEEPDSIWLDDDDTTMDEDAAEEFAFEEKERTC